MVLSFENHLERGCGGLSQSVAERFDWQRVVRLELASVFLEGVTGLTVIWKSRGN